jgi:mono/diheme cytochrome c family protein
LNAISKDLLSAALKDSDPQVRRAAIWIGETYIKQNDAELIAQLGKMTTDPNDDVKVQLLLSLGSSKNAQAQKIAQDILSQNANHEMLRSSKASMDKHEDFKLYGRRLGSFAASDRKLLLEGAQIYQSMCSPCHGGDGKGLASNAAPVLVGSKRLNGDKSNAIRILLHGLKGPIEGKTFLSEMPAMKDNTDEWVAAVLSYGRYEFATNQGAAARNKALMMVQPEEVKKIRDQHKKVKKAWTLEELEKLVPPAPAAPAR